MLGDDGNQSVHGAGLAVENLAFAIDDILLEIIGNGLADAEVFQGVGHLVAKFIAQPEEMIHSSACRQNDGRILGHIDFRLSKLFRRETFHLDELTENDLNTIFLFNVKVRRLF